MLFVKQKSSSTTTYLQPRKTHPFSWQKFTSKQLMINVGNSSSPTPFQALPLSNHLTYVFTAWSTPITVTEDAHAKLVITPPGMKRSYNLLMEVKNLDDYTRVVIWRCWIHLRNHTKRDLYVNLNYEDTTSGIAYAQGSDPPFVSDLP